MPTDFIVLRRGCVLVEIIGEIFVRKKQRAFASADADCKRGISGDSPPVLEESFTESPTQLETILRGPRESSANLWRSFQHRILKEVLHDINSISSYESMFLRSQLISYFPFSFYFSVVNFN
ncbi:uncharacterized protein A4U43_C07F1720 [Asparagus officinalis]|uniref:Uncharacterized protein n=1 Tax=Asparagus officinalis TaxID=4686 RepID=A0A5P1EBX6_ASPOF|nr:uncharacterized protein A4U43_C07F1720 [Asparagus officinalis]